MRGGRSAGDAAHGCNKPVSLAQGRIGIKQCAAKPRSALLLTLFGGLEAVLQADGAVENQVFRGRVLAVGAEVAQTHELEGLAGLGFLQTGFHLAAGEDF